VSGLHSLVLPLILHRRIRSVSFIYIHICFVKFGLCPGCILFSSSNFAPLIEYVYTYIHIYTYTYIYM
jgi:hypothetical protein